MIHSFDPTKVTQEHVRRNEGFEAVEVLLPGNEAFNLAFIKLTKTEGIHRYPADKNKWAVNRTCRMTVLIRSGLIVLRQGGDEVHLMKDSVVVVEAGVPYQWLLASAEVEMDTISDPPWTADQHEEIEM